MKDNMPNYAVQFYDPEEAKMGRPRDESYIVVAVAADTATEAIGLAQDRLGTIVQEKKLKVHQVLVKIDQPGHR